MTWRWFYSTEESDTALKAILDASKFSREYTRNENALTDGVFEYKVWIEQDSEFELLGAKIDNAKIRALAAPERVTQFGNIKPDNYFDSSKYAAGCDARDTDTLANMAAFLNSYLATGNLFAQRDLDIQGSASLGTVAITLSSIYKKTYNIPVNGTVTDRTLVKSVKDSTSISATQTNATCNSAMFDFPKRTRKKSAQTLTTSGWTASPADATALAALQDDKISTTPSQTYSANGTSWVKLDFGEVITTTELNTILYLSNSTGSEVNIQISSDDVTYTTLKTYTSADNANIVGNIQTNKTFRYVRFYCTRTTGGIDIKIHEVLAAV